MNRIGPSLTLEEAGTPTWDAAVIGTSVMTVEAFSFYQSETIFVACGAPGYVGAVRVKMAASTQPTR